MEQARGDDVQAFARTFAPDEHRPPYRQSLWQLQWLGVGVVLVLAALAIVVSAWFAYQHAIPESMLRRSAGETFAAAQERNGRAAPFVGLSALPLLLGGAWLLAKRPSNDGVRLVAGGAAGVFFVMGMLAAVLTG